MGVPWTAPRCAAFLHLLFGLHGDNGALHHSRVRGLLAHPLTRAFTQSCRTIGALTRAAPNKPSSG